MVDVLKVKKLSIFAQIPTKATSKSAGFDLRSPYQVIMPGNSYKPVVTDISVQLPPGCYGRIAGRSSLALQHGIDVGGGVIDEDFRGNLTVILFNHSAQDFNIFPGNKVAQLILEMTCDAKVELVQELNETERGDRGFGSSGT